jgi:integrase/recombinase XerD
MSDKSISPLRQRLIDDMTARRYGEKAQKAYVRHVRTFTAFLGRSPDTATKEDLRGFQLHLAQQPISAGSINAAIAALRFFFNVTLERPEIVRPLRTVNKPRRAPVVLSQEEVARLLEAAPSLKYKAALSVAYGAGLRVSEVANLKVSDIDSGRMMLRVEQGKGQRDRYGMLSPQLLELLRDWWRAARPPVWRFPGQNPINPITPRQLNRAVTAAKDLAGISKRVSPHTPRVTSPGVRHPSARAGRRHSRDPGVARTRETRDDGALHPRRRQHGPRHQEPARAAGRQPREPIAARLIGAAWRGPRIAVRGSPTSFAPMGRLGARPTPVA